MYATYFGLSESPFSITPDPRYLYMSARHREAMAHLVYGLTEGGGFVQLTGEVGTGKTTLCRCMMQQLPDHLDVALILNPRVTEIELLGAICDELRVDYPAGATIKTLVDALNQHLLSSHASGRRTVVVIDEAQNLSMEVLEQVRLLTNLETAKEKLLQIILVGQTELLRILERPELRQLAQRITARYHLLPLSLQETEEYIRYRLGVAGRHSRLFTSRAAVQVHRCSRGVPRLINVICDRALLGAYAADRREVSAAFIRAAAGEVLGTPTGAGPARHGLWAGGLAAAVAVSAVLFLPPQLSEILGRGEVVVSLESPTDAGEAMRDTPQAPGSSTTTSAPAIAGVAAATQEPAYTSRLDPSAPRRPDATGPPTPVPGFEPVLDTSMLSEPPTPGSFALSAFLEDETRDFELEHALGRVVRLWNEDVQIEGVACDASSKIGLQCLAARGTWEDVRAYDRAAVLALETGDGLVRYVTLTGLDGRRATFEGGDGARSFAIDELDRYWTGDYIVVWRPPPRASVAPAWQSSGYDVVWLRQALDRVAGTPDASPLPNPGSPDFDEPLRERVMEFQRRHALSDTGIAGVDTLIRLNGELDPGGIPFLSRRSVARALAGGRGQG